MNYVLLGFLLIVPTSLSAQTACFDYGRVLSCEGPNGNQTITRFNDRYGAITNNKGETDPFTIIRPHHDDDRHSRTRHDDGVRLPQPWDGGAYMPRTRYDRYDAQDWAE